MLIIEQPNNIANLLNDIRLNAFGWFIETTADAISIKGTLKLDTPVIESSMQEAEVMA